jgi:hypothetical protein
MFSSNTLMKHSGCFVFGRNGEKGQRFVNGKPRINGVIKKTAGWICSTRLFKSTTIPALTNHSSIIVAVIHHQLST